MTSLSILIIAAFVALLAWPSIESLLLRRRRKQGGDRRYFRN